MSIFEYVIRYLDKRSVSATKHQKIPVQWDLGANYLLSPAVCSILELKRFSAAIGRDPASFFACQGIPAFSARANWVQFESSIRSDDLLNNTVLVRRYLPPGGVSPRASLVLTHHWNGSSADYVSFCEGIAKVDVEVFALDLPYHGTRSTFPLQKGARVVHEMLSSNLGRTIRSFQQAVCDVVALVMWLQRQSGRPVILGGVSMGSAVAALASAQLPNVSGLIAVLPVMNLPSVVWNGAATEHIRHGIELSLTYEDLEACWSCISPTTYRSVIRARPSLSIVGRYDTVAPPQQSIDFFSSAGVGDSKSTARVVSLSSGHHSLTLPWNALRVIRSVKTFVSGLLPA